jgi:dinuclear metal center YbgI/SA1388 family protein
MSNVKIKELLYALERFAPLPLQEDYDNAGLQIGLTETEASGALLCLDVNEEIVDEAIRKGCNVIVSHHPLLFHALKSITGSNYVQRTVMKAIQAGVTIISMHTNMDACRGGVNFKMAEKIGLKDVHFFDAKTAVNGVEAGEGVMGTLVETLSAESLVAHLKDVFHAECAMCNALLRRPISKVALCGGAGSFLLDDAIDAGADAFVTGEMHYHEYFGHEQEIQIVVLGHFETEQYTNEIFYSILRGQFPSLSLFLAETKTNPINYL